jgi:hypothetical protein
LNDEGSSFLHFLSACSKSMAGCEDDYFIRQTTFPLSGKLLYGPPPSLAG